MKQLYAVVCLALLATACQESPKATETRPLLKTDSSFVAGPELPQKDTQPLAPVTPVQQTPAPAPARKKQTGIAQTGDNPASTPTASGDGKATQPAAETTQKGWSKTAKGAVIGGVVGAGAGAVINKRNRGAGAVIGGVVGAGAGAVIGHGMDKKDGRH